MYEKICMTGILTMTAMSIPAIVGPPVTGNGYKLQEELNT